MAILPTRAVKSADRILVRLGHSTSWTPQDRDIAAAIIANEMGADKALLAIRVHLEAVKLVEKGETEAGKLKFEEAKKMMLSALNRD